MAIHWGGRGIGHTSRWTAAASGGTPTPTPVNAFYGMNLGDSWYYSKLRSYMNLMWYDGWRGRPGDQFSYAVEPYIDADGNIVSLESGVTKYIKVLGLPTESARVRITWTGGVGATVAMSGGGYANVTSGSGWIEADITVQPDRTIPALTYVEVQSFTPGDPPIDFDAREVGASLSAMFDPAYVDNLRQWPGPLRFMGYQNTNDAWRGAKTNELRMDWADRVLVPLAASAPRNVASVTIGSGNGALTIAAGGLDGTVLAAKLAEGLHWIGGGGNNVSIEIQAASGAGSVNVTGMDIVVVPAAAANTANAVKAQIEANATANKLVSCTVGGTGASAIGTTAKTNLAGGTFGFQFGMPMEHIVELCTLTGRRPWVCLPSCASVDYATGFGAALNTLPAQCRPAIAEFSNELWNPGFAAHTVLNAEGIAAGFPNNYLLRQHASRHIELMAAVVAECPDVQRVISVQNANTAAASTLLGYLGTASDHTDLLASAPYFLNDNGLAGWATADIAFAAAETSVNTILDTAVTLKGIANGAGLEYSIYEGGQHALAGSMNLATYQAFQRDDRFYDANLYYLSEVKYRLDSPTTGLFADIFTINVSSGAWGHYEYQGQVLADAPKARSALDAIAGDFVTYLRAVDQPVVTGSREVGEDLTATVGTPRWAASMSHYWTRKASGASGDGTAIPGETGLTYTQTASDEGMEVNIHTVLTGVGGEIVEYETDDNTVTTAASGYVAEADALFARFTSDPGATRKGHINTLITALKTGAISGSDIWAKLDVLFIFAAHDSQAALLNWVSSSYNGTANNSPTFTTDRGYAGNGSSAYISTAFNPFTSPSPKFVRDSSHMGVWSRTNSTNANYWEIGNFSGSSLSLNCRSTNANTIRARLNYGSHENYGSTADSVGHHMLSRTASNLTTAYKSGSSVGTSAGASLGVFNETIGILRAAGLYTTRELAAAHWGAGLTANETADLNNALQAYMTAVGA